MKKLLILSSIILTLAAIFYILPSNQDTTPISSSPKPKILLTSHLTQEAGGITTFILSLVQSELNTHFELAVAAPETSDIYKACNQLGIKTYPCTFPFKFKKLTQVLPASKALRDILKEYKPDIIHTSGSHDRSLVTWNALFLEKKPSIVQTFHGVKIISKDPYHWLFYNKLIDVNMFISNSASKINAKKKGLKLNNVCIIENAVDLKKFKPTPKDPTLQEQLGIPKDYFVFGSNAGLQDYKRVDLMLDALTHFPPDSRLKVVLVGRNPQPWIEKAKAMGVDHFLVWTDFQEDVRPFCALFDVGFILSTRIETSSFASREMLAMGIPLISSFFSGLKDNVDNHINGVFVEPGNAEDVYNAMNFFLNMPPSELKEYRKNARLKAERSFDSKIQLHAISNLYNDLLKKKTIKENASIPIASLLSNPA